MSPTYINTYSHTLSLHAALPISVDRPPGPEEQHRGAGQVREDLRHSDHHHHRRVRGLLGLYLSRAAGCVPRPEALGADLDERLGRPEGARRSEEHTSELQSLMRISYAVLCLQQTTHIRHH